MFIVVLETSFTSRTKYRLPYSAAACTWWPSIEILVTLPAVKPGIFIWGYIQKVWDTKVPQWGQAGRSWSSLRTLFTDFDCAETIRVLKFSRRTLCFKSNSSLLLRYTSLAISHSWSVTEEFTHASELQITPCCILTPSAPAVSKCCCSKSSAMAETSRAWRF